MPASSERGSQGKRPRISLRGYFVVIAVAWTGVVILSLLWAFHHQKQERLEVARSQARMAHEKDLVYRRWNAGKGGVYVPSSEATPPNPHLADVPERDIQTPSGKKLTLVNPAYMTRQAHELAKATQGVLGHITSLNPIRPDNAPDAWERRALEEFTLGATEVSSIERLNGRPYMRLMRPLVTEESCLNCHARQGYRAGDIRGGISVAVPLDSVLAMSEQVTAAMIGGHFLLWLVGLVGLGIATRRSGRQIRDYQAFEQTLHESNARLSETLNRERQTSMTLEATLQQLAAATREAKAATQAKSEFLAAMSHEIRSPMTSILGFAESLLEPGIGAEEKKTAVETIRRNGQHLLELINDVLDLSKIEANMLDVEHVRTPLVPFLAELDSLMRSRALSKGLEFSIEYDGEVPETIETDPTRLRQVLINLLGNAVKFTDSGSVCMKVSLLRSTSGDREISEDHYLQFEVIDTGIGLLPEQEVRLFRPFSQGDPSTARQFGGTGLGLAISRRITERLGGTIRVKSTPNLGSTFTVTVSTGSLVGVQMLKDPSFVESEAKEPEAGQFLDKPLGCRILLAEDGPDNQRLIARLLTKAGADVTVVDNGKAALDTAMAAVFHRRANDPGKPFDVVLMDMQMPVMDGYEATRRLRERGYTLPILALTAHATTQDRDKCLEAGCDDFITKPIVRKTLIDAIKRHTTPGTCGRADFVGQQIRSGEDASTISPQKQIEAIRSTVADLHKALACQDYSLLTELSIRARKMAEEIDWKSIASLADTLEHTLASDRDIERMNRQVLALAALCESGPGPTGPVDSKSAGPAQA